MRSRRRIITFLSRMTTRILMIVCNVLCKLQHCYTDIVRLCLRLDQLCTALSKSNCSKGGPSIDIRMQWLSVLFVISLRKIYGILYIYMVLSSTWFTRVFAVGGLYLEYAHAHEPGMHTLRE